MGIPCLGGLYMLAEQARCAAQIFTGEVIPAIRTKEAYHALSRRKENRILIGMPGCGKSTVGQALAQRLDRPFVDCDQELERILEMPVGEYITHYGEEAFRAQETALLTQLGKASGLVIATGGGCVTRPENYPHLHQNGAIIFLERELSKLPKRAAPCPCGGASRICIPSVCPCTGGSRTSPWPTTARRRLWPRPWRKPMNILVINGPNLNLLGVREPDLYGKQDYTALVALVEETCAQEGMEVEVFQSNHEGAIVDRIQAALGTADGIVINPAAYTHTSVAILDALKAVNLPAVEVHISDVSQREDFRQVSYAGMACVQTYMGLGLEGYRKAILFLKDYLQHR